MLTMAKAHLRTHETLWVAVIVTELVLRTYQVVQLVFKTCQVVQKNLIVNKPNITFRATLMLLVIQNTFSLYLEQHPGQTKIYWNWELPRNSGNPHFMLFHCTKIAQVLAFS